MTTTNAITRQRVSDDRRVNKTAEIFGINFPLKLEPFVYSITKGISSDYNGGYWVFYILSNGGFYMAPDSDSPFNVTCGNGFEDTLSADALGITACMYAYSHLSFAGINGFAETCAQQYHWLRDFMLEHSEVRAIVGAMD